MIEDYLNQTGYRVHRSVKELYDDDSASTLTLTGTAPTVNYRLRITLSGADCAGTITVNATETLTFTSATTKATTTTLTANTLPTVTTANLNCNILIQCIDLTGSLIYEETALELDCRFQDTQKAFQDPTGKWTNSSAIVYTNEDSCNIGTTFSYNGYDYNIAQVSVMTDLDGSEEGRKLFLTGKSLSPDRAIEVDEDVPALTRYMTKATYDVDEDGIVDLSRMSTISKTAGSTITQYDSVTIDPATNKVIPARANSSATMPVIGIAQEAAVLNGIIEVAIAGESSVRPDVALVSGSHVFLSAATAGVVTQTVPSAEGTYIQDMGVASSASTIIIDIKKEIYRRPS